MHISIIHENLHYSVSKWITSQSEISRLLNMRYNVNNQTEIEKQRKNNSKQQFMDTRMRRENRASVSK